VAATAPGARGAQEPPEGPHGGRVGFSAVAEGFGAAERRSGASGVFSTRRRRRGNSALAGWCCAERGKRAANRPPGPAGAGPSPGAEPGAAAGASTVGPARGRGRRVARRNPKACRPPSARAPRVTRRRVPDRERSVRNPVVLVAGKCGCPAGSPAAAGPNVIDPGRTAVRPDASSPGGLRDGARGGAVRSGTGQPRPPPRFYGGSADALSAAGCVILTPTQGRCVDITTRFDVRTHNLEYVRGVAPVRKAGARSAGRETGAPAQIAPAVPARARRSRGLRRTSCRRGRGVLRTSLRGRSDRFCRHRPGRCGRPRAVCREGRREGVRGGPAR
jgi:hypothetical protein